MSRRSVSYMSNEYLTSKRLTSFTSFSSAWGAGRSKTRTTKQTAGRIAEKKDQSCSDAVTLIRTRISFHLLGSALVQKSQMALIVRVVPECEMGDYIHNKLV